MGLMGLTGVHRGRRRGITRCDPARQPYPDLVRREFHQKAPDRLWVADLTQHATGEGWFYLGVVLDAFSRRVVGWAMGDRPTTELSVNALKMALVNRRPEGGVVHHSDHGVQYTASAFERAMCDGGVRGSMGRVGDALDNAMADSFFATVQTELLDRRSWPTREALRSAVFEYIEVFYNRRRRHSSLGYLSPDDHERRWYTLNQASIATATTSYDQSALSG